MPPGEKAKIMRRRDIHTGDLLAWRYWRNGSIYPGIALGPTPMDHLGSKFVKANPGASCYLLLTPWKESLKTMIDTAVDNGCTEPGPDFWGVGSDVRDFVVATQALMEDVGEVVKDVEPDGWGWSRVTATRILGTYQEVLAEDIRRKQQNAAQAKLRGKERESNAERLRTVQKRLNTRELAGEKVELQTFRPIGSDLTVVVPISFLESLLDGVERIAD
jgi:hypothetical protein